MAVSDVLGDAALRLCDAENQLANEVRAFPKLLVLERKRIGITAKALAAKVEISPQYLSDIENRKRPINVELAKRIATAVYDLQIRGGE